MAGAGHLPEVCSDVSTFVHIASEMFRSRRDGLVPLVLPWMRVLENRGSRPIFSVLRAER